MEQLKLTKEFKTFCIWNIVKSLYQKHQDPHMTERGIDASYNVSLYEKDAELLDTKHPSISSTDPSIKIKIDKSFFPFGLGVSLAQMKDISESFQTENVWVSGDGYDYQYGEYTSGHDSEVEIVVLLDNPTHLRSQFNEWKTKRDILKEEKKSTKKKTI